MLHHYPYTAEELAHLHQLLFHENPDNLKLAIELIRGQGFHQELERPLGLLQLSRIHRWDPILSTALEKLYKSRIDRSRRKELQEELAIFSAFDEAFVLSSISFIELKNALALFQQHYLDFFQNRPLMLGLLQELASGLYREGYAELALDVYEMATHQGAKDADLYFEMALILQNEFNHLDEAKKYYHLALLLDDQDYVAHNNLGQVYESLSCYSAAETHLTKALDIYPNYLHAVVNLAFIRWRHQGRIEDAIKLYETALSIDSYESFALCNYAALLCRHQKNRLDDAELMIRRALMIDEEDDYALKILGRILALKGDVAAALSAYQKAQMLNPNDSDLLEEIQALQSKKK